MSIDDTQKRKRKYSGGQREHTDEDKYRTRMQTSTMNRFGRITIKRLFLGIVIVIVLIKLWQLFPSQSPRRESAPPDARAELPKWRYTNNPQGTTEERLNKLINTLTSGEELWFKRPEDDAELERSRVAWQSPVPKVQSVYKSSGSLTFKDGHFILQGKRLRILSGAMHYFRVVPQYWEDRMDKMKACGLNTLET